MQIIAKNDLQNGITILTNQNKIVAVAEADANRLKCLKVFQDCQ